VSAMGSLEQVRERIAEYHSAGATTVALVPVTAEDPGGKRLLTAIGGDAR
jgi:alkanesulfonate monooxygenase SsuD/methylene tetrahydromethanopterin reductase-like flavin-dependent oxidoreductase (luciferase family)